MSSLKDKYNKEVKPELQKKYNYKNVMQIPAITKVIINRGLGEAAANSKLIEGCVDEFKDLTGQKPVVTHAKKSISNFKIRQGQAIGCKVTLRSKKMYDFLSKLINIVLPKIRDFRGISNNAFDGAGNYTLGIKESTIFPEVNYEKIDRIRGYDITIVTSAKTDAEAKDLFHLLGMPFRRN
jgi:large subunit ribosomal protein L5